MNAPSRREKIEGMLAQRPSDQFLRYALAMELEKEGAYERSLELFRGLMQDAVPYVPSFQMAAQYLAQREQIEESREILRTGVEEARRQGNSHAASEMAELLASLGSR